MRTGELERRHLRDLHALALQGRVLPQAAVAYLRRALLVYEDNREKAGAARDLAQFEYSLDEDSWGNSINRSLAWSYDERHHAHGADKQAITREIGVTRAVKGSLLLSRVAKYGGTNEKDSDDAYESIGELQAARRELKSTRRSFRPDQLEIDIAFAEVIARRYSNHYGTPVFFLAKTALLAQTRREHGRDRAKLARKLTFRRKSYAQEAHIRQNVIELSPISTIHPPRARG